MCNMCMYVLKFVKIISISVRNIICLFSNVRINIRYFSAIDLKIYIEESGERYEN